MSLENLKEVHDMFRALFALISEWWTGKAWPRMCATASSIESAWSASLRATPVPHLVTAVVTAVLTLFLRWVLG